MLVLVVLIVMMVRMVRQWEGNREGERDGGTH